MPLAELPLMSLYAKLAIARRHNTGDKDSLILDIIKEINLRESETRKD